MKTAEDLAIDIKHGLMWNQHAFKAETDKDYLTSVIKQIQLDAMKEGMRRAARMCFDVQTERMIIGLKVDGAMDCQVTIEQKLEQLTEKDL